MINETLTASPSLADRSGVCFIPFCVNAELKCNARVRDCRGNPLAIPMDKDCNGKRGITPKAFINIIQYLPCRLRSKD